MVAVLDNLEACVGEIFNIGADTSITTGEGIRILEQVMGQPASLKRVPKRPGDQMQTRANIIKARRILGYDPSTTTKEGLEQQLQWYRERIFGKIDL
jgi:nucleoside-diphosphate-sugar epimerase